MKFDKRSIFLVLSASFLFGICILCYIYASIGSDSITVFEEGMSKFFHITIGNAINIYNITFIVLALLISRKNMGWASILNAVVIGSLVNLLEPIIKPLLILSSGIYYRLLLFAVGQILCCLACALLIISGAGMSAIDALAEKLASTLNIKFKYGRISIDAILMLLGYLMGGVIGIGSILTIILTGPMISFFVDLLNKNDQVIS